jgi:hypothetical protein
VASSPKGERSEPIPTRSVSEGQTPTISGLGKFHVEANTDREDSHSSNAVASTGSVVSWGIFPRWSLAHTSGWYAVLRTAGEHSINAEGILQPEPRVAQRTLGYDADHPREARPEFPENRGGVLQMGSKQTDIPKHRILKPSPCRNFAAFVVGFLTVEYRKPRLTPEPRNYKNAAKSRKCRTVAGRRCPASESKNSSTVMGGFFSELC